jgi:hypothetical protein
VAVAAIASAPTAGAADGAAVTVKWTGGNDPALQSLQPPRDPASIHYGDFENVSVSIDRNTDLVDEALEVEVSGFNGPTAREDYANSGGATYGANFVQAMQCWGDPADPKFYETCLVGGFRSVQNASGKPPVAQYGLAGSALDRGTNTFDVPFRAVTGTSYSSLMTPDPERPNNFLPPAVDQVVSSLNTNEKVATVDSTGTARFTFETQSAASQPYLGCGDEASGAGTRCWLVVVPRGEHNSVARENCETSSDPRERAVQEGSAINPACDYWANRVVIPLDFRPTGPGCPPGSAEEQVVGNEAIVAAFTSWQTAVCRANGQAYSLTTSSDTVVREQLLQGETGMGFTSRPLTPTTLRSAEAAQSLADTELVYAPIAVSAVGIAFRAEKESVITNEMRLTPRLVAKMITASYRLDQGLSSYTVEPVPGPWAGSNSSCNQNLIRDPEFRALNPRVSDLPQGPVIVLTGPNPSDAIAQLWQYLQSDDKARAFLSGEADNVLPGDEGNCGIKINPYYLPAGHADARVPEFEEATVDGKSTLLPKLTRGGDYIWRQVGLSTPDGTPVCLCDAPEDTFRKADQTLQPQQVEQPDQPRYDILQPRPYAVDLAASARQVYRIATGARTIWTRPNPEVPGSYSSVGEGGATRKFLTGFTDAPAAERYALPMVQLQAANQPNVFLQPDAASMSTAVSARVTSEVEGVTDANVAGLPADAYPLTTVVYAAVNLPATDAASRDHYADLIEYAVTDGQVSGHSIGQLPVGYQPLPDDLKAQALSAAAEIRAYVNPTESAPEGEGGGTAEAVVPPSSSATGAAPPAAAAAPPTTNTSVSPAAVSAARTTSATGNPAGGVLGGTLVAGVLGALAAPFLLRRRSAA